MNVAILGFGSQGASALAYWQALGHTVTVCDRNESLELPDGVAAQLGAGYLQGLDRFDLAVRSPSIHPRDIVAANNPTILKKITTNTNEFIQVCPTRNIIGVTGTKGKGTTSTLIARMLEAAGHRVHLGGNIGTPPLEMLSAGIEAADYVVLELANFQLIDLKHSPHIAVCLMVEPEHQDWHGDMDDYLAAKKQLFRWQTDDDVAIYYAENSHSKEIASTSAGQKIPYLAEPGAVITDDTISINGTEICKISEIQLRGRHNWQNICSAVTAVWQLTHDAEAIRRAVRGFSGLPFRLEFVRELDNVQYYNDSFGTTPETAIVAIKAFEQPKVIILGGSDKGADYSKLAQTVVDSNVRHVVMIGKTAETILDEIDRLQTSRRVERTVLDKKPTMGEIVVAARQHAEPGDVVLLSPACASFGLFVNYQDRGEQFNEAVLSLA